MYIVCTQFKNQTILLHPYIGPYQVLLLRARVGQGVMAMKGYTYTPKIQHYWSLTIRLSVIIRTLVGVGGWWFLPLCSDAVSIFYIPNRLDVALA